MERILHVKENLPHFQERVLRRLFYEHFSLGILTNDLRLNFVIFDRRKFVIVIKNTDHAGH